MAKYLSLAAIVLVAFAAGVAAVRYIPQRPAVLSGGVAQAVEGPYAKEDAALLADLYREFAAIVEEDAARTQPLLNNMQDVLPRIWAIGHLSVGPGWKISSRYPGLASEIEKHIRTRVQIGDTEVIDESSRQRIVSACLSIAEELEAK